MEKNRNVNISDLDMSICLSENDKNSSPTSHVTLRKQPDRQNQFGNLPIDEDSATAGNFVSLHQQMKDTQPSELFREQFNDFKVEMRRLLSFFTASQKSELADMNSTLKEVQKSNNNIKISIEYLTSQNEELKNHITVLKKKC